MVEERDRGREAAAGEASRRPRVALDLDDDRRFVSASSIGDDPALEPSCGVENLRRSELLAPETEIETLLGSRSARFGPGEPTRLGVAASSRDAAGRPYETTIQHDLATNRELADVPKGVQRNA